MSWFVFVTKSARKQLKKIPKKDSLRIEKVVDEMEIDPFTGDVQKISQYENKWRRRVGSYRIKYEINIATKFVSVFDIKRRTSSTY
ncbi:MAG: type II toxin-antitoxin system RelE/ParE family toxin [Patescibacteria group bacterium]